jgi:hypothetical protein
VFGVPAHHDPSRPAAPAVAPPVAGDARDPAGGPLEAPTALFAAAAATALMARIAP